MAAIVAVGEPMVPPRAPSFCVRTVDVWSASRPAKPASRVVEPRLAEEKTWLR